MKIKETIEALKEIGFTEYEAKVYLALLRSHPSNGNAIATLSGVPGPKVYETLRRLERREIAFITSGGDNKQTLYSPLPYEDLLNVKKEKFITKISFLMEALSEISSTNLMGSTSLFVINGYTSIVDSIQTAITQSETEIVMSSWYKDFVHFRKFLLEAHNRGVKVVTLTFDHINEELPWKHFEHFNKEIIHNRHAGELSVVFDSNKAIVLQSSNQSPHAVVSNHKAMISTIRNYIRHDIYVNRVVHDFEEEMKKKYGSELMGLIGDF